MLPILPLPGDTVLVQGINHDTGRGKLHSRIIRHCQLACAEEYDADESTWTHAGILESWGNAYRHTRVIEAHPIKGVTKAWYTDREPFRWVVLRHPRVRHEYQRQTIVADIDQRIGNRYGWSELFWMYIRHLRRQWAHIKVDVPGQEFCTEACALAYAAAGVTYPTHLEPAQLWPAELRRLWKHGDLISVYDSGPAVVQRSIPIFGNLQLDY